VTQQVNAIFEACTFQDLTGQRIRRAIQHLQQVEGMLAGMMQDGPAAEAESGQAGSELEQNDIDSLFA
jgi:chemotaxis protein CheZ